MKQYTSKFLDANFMVLHWVAYIALALALLLPSTKAWPAGIVLPAVVYAAAWEDSMPVDPATVSSAPRLWLAGHYRNSRLCPEANGDGATQSRLMLLTAKDESINTDGVMVRAYPAFTRQYACDRLRPYSAM